MAKKKANEEIVKVIYDLAGKPERVHFTGRATGDMFRLGLTKCDVCDAIREWIDSKNDVLKDVTRHVKEFTGEAIYIIKPHIFAEKRYIEMGIRQNITTGEYLLIISSHECD